MPTATINPPLSICEYDEEFTLLPSTNNGHWSGTGITNPFTGVFDPIFANNGVNNLTFTIVNGACTFSDSTIITVNEKPSSLFSINGSNFCEGRDLYMQYPENPSTANYSWTLESDTDTIISTESNPNFSLQPGTWNISLEVENKGCNSTDSIFSLIVFDTVAPHTPSIIRSTVSEEAVLTEWNEPQYGIEKITGFQIWRSVDSVNFSMIDEIENSMSTYMDYDTKIHEQNYYYLIIPSNVCHVQPEQNDMSSSILLEKVELNGDKVQFTWSEYYKWQYGVEYYELQKRESSGDWETIKQIDGADHSVIIDKP